MSPHQYIQLDSLPEEVRKKVLAFIASLMEQWEQRRLPTGSPKERWKEAACIRYCQRHTTIPDDFDAPLDDFKEYME